MKYQFLHLAIRAAFLIIAGAFLVGTKFKDGVIWAVFVFVLIITLLATLDIV